MLQPRLSIMFSSKHEVHLDLSTDLRETSDWKIGVLGDRPLEYLLNATTLAFDPVSGLLAVGTLKLLAKHTGGDILN